MSKKLGFVSRSALASQRAATISETDRSVEFIAATDEPVEVWDWETWRPIREVLLMSGRVDPPTGQVPLLDAHMSYSVDAQLGSFRDIRTEEHTTVGRVYISSTREDVWTKLKEGHITDCSVGYLIRIFETLKDGVEKIYDGLTIAGPCRVVTSWELKELSLCPIGADPGAKARADKIKEEYMPKNKGRMEATPEEQQDLEDEISDIINEVAGGDLNASEAEAEVAAVIDEAVNDETGQEEDREEDEEDKEERSRQAVLSERKRGRELEAMCRQAQMPDAYRKAFVERGLTVEQARKVVLKKMIERSQKGPSFYGDVRVLNDEKRNFSARALDSILLRGGLKLESPAPGARELQGLSLRELARECLRASGKSDETGSTSRMVERALATTDLPKLLIEASNRFLMQGFEEANETWSLWTGEGSAIDYRENSLIDVGIDNTLEEVGEGDEYTFSQMAEAVEKYKVIKYGRMFAITLEAIVNDDLNALTKIPESLGRGAARTVGDAVYGVLIGNSVMGDKHPLFSAPHNNLLAGGGVPNVDTLGEAETKMGLQTDLMGRTLNIMPEFFLGPLSLKVASEIFFNSEYIGTQALPTTRNIYQGYATRIYEPRLDIDSKSSWYLLGPKGMTVNVYYLDGQRQPYLATKEGWNIDGVEHKVRFNVGVAPVSWRGLLKSQK